jgi:hypothetical protein
MDPHGEIGEEFLEEKVEASRAGCPVGVVVGVDQQRLAANACRDEPVRRPVGVLQEGGVGRRPEP